MRAYVHCGVRACVCVSLPLQLDHIVEVHTVHAAIKALSELLALHTKPDKLQQFIRIAKTQLNDPANGESVPRCVNMFRSASQVPCPGRRPGGGWCIGCISCERRN